MIEVSAWSQAVSVTARELTYQETGDLDRLRAVLASACDRTDPRAISWLWDSMVTTHGGPAPAGFVEAVATALGDLLAVHVAGVRWAVWPGPAGPTLGVASAARPLSPVVPFLDAQARWDARAREWVVDYLSRAAAHLSGAALPQPRSAPDDGPVAAVEQPVPAGEPAAAYGETVDVTPLPSQPVDHAEAPYEPVATGLPTPALPTRAAAAPGPDAPHPTAPDPALPAPDLPSRGRIADVFARTSVVAPAQVPAEDLSPTAQVPEPTAEAPAAAESTSSALPTSDGPSDERMVDALEASPAVAAPASAPAPVLPETPLDDFALDALEHAMVLLRETGSFDREVFVLLIDGDGRRRTESCPGEAGDARFRARELVRASGAVRAATTYIDRDPADLPGPRQTFPAVVVDAWDAGVEGMRVGRRFVDDVLGTGPLGPPLVVGPIAPLL